jgi:nitrite reductase (cytochrome c-552)
MLKKLVLFSITLLLTILVAALLVNIFEHKQEAKLKYLKLVDIPENELDPKVWKQNFPREYDSYIKTQKTKELVKYSKWGRYGGSENFSKLDKYPDLKRMFAGYAFSVEYNEERGHMYSLTDSLSSQRLGDKKPGACIHCHSGGIFQVIDAMGEEKFYSSLALDIVEEHNVKHPVVCADCHNPKTMDLRVTRKKFKEAMERRGIDITQATRHQMRTYVCAQCHVEYYFKGPHKILTYPWDKGLQVDNIESYYDEIDFADWTHAETKAPMIKVQHPEFEMWSTGIHARSGVACSDCHMPYVREGAVKVTDHWVRTPLSNITNACLTCHRQTEEEMKSRVLEIQDKTYSLLTRAEKAILSAMDALKEAMAAGATDEELKEARSLHRKAQIRWDFVSAENSMGFHSPQEAARVLGDSIDYARQAEIAAYKVLTQRKEAQAKIQP